MFGVLLFLFFATNLSQTGGHPVNMSLGGVEQVFATLGRDCQVFGSNLSRISLQTLDATPIISGSSLYMVTLEDITVHHMDNYNVRKVHDIRSSQDNNMLYELELFYPNITAKSAYRVTGKVADVLPVSGRGLLEFRFPDVTATLQLLHDRTDNKLTVAVTNIDDSGSTIHHVTPSLEDDSRDSSFGHAMFWKFASLLADYLETPISECLKQKFTETRPTL